MQVRSGPKPHTGSGSNALSFHGFSGQWNGGEKWYIADNLEASNSATTKTHRDDVALTPQHQGTGMSCASVVQKFRPALVGLAAILSISIIDTAGAQSTEPADQDQGTCRKYLPMVGATVQVPCEDSTPSAVPQEAAGKDPKTCRKFLPAVGEVVEVPCEGEDAPDAAAPEQPCDRLAGEAVEFAKLIETATEGVTECRAAVSLFPNTRRFKFQLARSLHVKGEFGEALSLYRSLAEAGHAKAENNIGVMYERGLGVAKDDSEAVNWFRKSADQGYARAENNLGRKYDQGRGVPQDYVAAVDWYRKSADQGFAGGQAALGAMYAMGRGVAKDDAMAVALFRKAADQGLALGEVNLGIAYANGRGVEKNLTEAVGWYRKAAEHHNAVAERNLAIAYVKGEGIARDDAEAVKWLQKAADQGLAKAQTGLGVMYLNGRGVRTDKVQAYKWFNVAAPLDPIAVKDRDKLTPTMTSAQVAEAQKEAREWKPTPELSFKAKQ